MSKALKRWLVLYEDEGQPCEIVLVAVDKSDAIRELWRVHPYVAYRSARLLPRGIDGASLAKAEKLIPPAPPKAAQPLASELAPNGKALRMPAKARTGKRASQEDRALRERNPSA